MSIESLENSSERSYAGSEQAPVNPFDEAIRVLKECNLEPYLQNSHRSDDINMVFLDGRYGKDRLSMAIVYYSKTHSLRYCFLQDGAAPKNVEGPLVMRVFSTINGGCHATLAREIVENNNEPGTICVYAMNMTKKEDLKFDNEELKITSDEDLKFNYGGLEFIPDPDSTCTGTIELIPYNGAINRRKAKPEEVES